MRPLIAALACLALLLTACGGGDDDEPDDVTVPAGTPVSDSEYVKRICTGVNNYLDTVNSKGEEEIRESVRAWVDSLNQTPPPPDARDFHLALVRYVQQGLEEPTILITTNPPAADPALRERLGPVEASDGGCQVPIFGREPAATPTPGG